MSSPGWRPWTYVSLVASFRQSLTEPLIGRADPLFEPDPALPAQRAELCDIEQLARRAVRLGAVVDEAAFEADDLGDELRELGDRHIHAGADIDPFLRGPGLEEINRRIGKVVHVEEFAARRAGAPD